MYLFFDTETSGLPKNYKAPASDTDNWPRLVQLAYIVYDSEGKELIAQDLIVKPVDFIIPKEASDIHGIPHEKALEVGLDLTDVLDTFGKDSEKCEFLVAHNMNYDKNILGAELIRNEKNFGVSKKKLICTMESTTDFCKIPNQYGYKWPKLEELHKILFGYDFANAHDALIDIRVTANCFWELRRRSLI